MTTRRKSARASITACTAAGLTAAMHLGGCAFANEPGGPRASYDRYVYESTEWMPQTVTLRDTRTGEALWAMDVPVGKQLIMQFRPAKSGDTMYPDTMEWALADRGKGARLDTSINVPASTARMVVPTLRPAPEMAGAMLTPDDFPEPMPIDEAPLPAPEPEPTPEPAPEPAQEEPPAAEEIEENGGGEYGQG